MSLLFPEHVRLTVELDPPFLAWLNRLSAYLENKQFKDAVAALQPAVDRLKDLGRPDSTQLAPGFTYFGEREMANPTKAVPPELQAVVDQLNAATNDVAAKIEFLNNKISTSMSQADVEDVKGQLGTVVMTLKSLAADPNNPVPPPAPQA